MKTCEYNSGRFEGPRCHKQAIVGVGEKPKWVCLDHYQLWLKEAKAILSRFDTVTPAPDDDDSERVE